MSSVYVPRPVRNRRSSLRRTGAPIPVSGMSFPPHRMGAGADGLHDIVVAGAAADVALKPFADFPFARVGMVLHQIQRAHHHAGGAETTLQAMIVTERLLHRVQLPVLGQPFDGEDVSAFGLDRQQGAALDGATVDMDDAGAALAGIAPDMGASKAEFFA